LPARYAPLAAVNLLLRSAGAYLVTVSFWSPFLLPLFSCAEHGYLLRVCSRVAVLRLRSAVPVLIPICVRHLRLPAASVHNAISAFSLPAACLRWVRTRACRAPPLPLFPASLNTTACVLLPLLRCTAFLLPVHRCLFCLLRCLLRLLFACRLRYSLRCVLLRARVLHLAAVSFACVARCVPLRIARNTLLITARANALPHFLQVRAGPLARTVWCLRCRYSSLRTCGVAITPPYLGDLPAACFHATPFCLGGYIPGLPACLLLPSLPHAKISYGFCLQF